MIFFFCLLKNWRHHQTSELLYCALQLYGHGAEVKVIYSAGVHRGVGETRLVFQPGVDILKSPCAPALKAPCRCQFSILKPDPLFNNASLSTSGGRREEIYHPVQPGLGGERGGNGDDEQRRHCTALQRLERGGGWGGACQQSP